MNCSPCGALPSSPADSAHLVADPASRAAGSTATATSGLCPPPAPETPCCRHRLTSHPCLREGPPLTPAAMAPIQPLLARARSGVDQEAARRADTDSGSTLALGSLESSPGVTVVTTLSSRLAAHCSVSNHAPQRKSILVVNVD